MKYIQNYKEIKAFKTKSARDIIRTLALDGLSIIDNLKGIEEYLKKPRIQFLYIHHVFKDEEQKLDKLLKRLSKHHTFISYSDAVSKIINREIDKPYISISSDDGFKNNLFAAKIMNEYGAKGCFFINPATIDNLSYSEIEKHCKEKLNFPPVEFLNWNEVEELQKMGHEIGSHTMSHINVANTSAADFAIDCEKTYQTLVKNCGQAKHFAFPYGRFFHFNDAARKIVFDAGFISCATAERGCHINHDVSLTINELCILRDHVILDWNIDHIFHFLANNSKQANSKNNLFPY